jgi:hypothetical protein
MRHILFFAFVVIGCTGTASQEPPPSPPPAPSDTPDAGRRCIQNVMCMRGWHWDVYTCTCVQ